MGGGGYLEKHWNGLYACLLQRRMAFACANDNIYGGGGNDDISSAKVVMHSYQDVTKTRMERYAAENGNLNGCSLCNALPHCIDNKNSRVRGHNSILNFCSI